MTADSLKAGVERLLAVAVDKRKSLSNQRTKLVALAEWERRAGNDDNVKVIDAVIAHVDKLATPHGA